MKKLSKKGLLAGAMATLVALSACESREKRAEREALAEQERKAEQRAAQDREDKLTLHLYDSLMNVPNVIGGSSAYGFKEEMDAFYRSDTKGTYRELDSLLHASQKDLLMRRIEKDAKPIIARGMQKIKQSLSCYDFLQLDIDAASKYVNPYGGVIDEWVQDDFVKCLLQKSSVDNYGKDRKQEIVKIIEAGYQNMLSELKKHRFQIAKEFAVYYPELDINQVPQQYKSLFKADAAEVEDEGGKYYEYSYLHNNSIAVVRRVSVYDSKLKPEFFNDEHADYKLIKVSNGKWQVVKKSKKTGKVIAKTPVFSHNVDYCLEGNAYSDYTKIGECNFWASAGANIGVHVTVEECVWVSKQPKSDALPQSKETQQRIAKLSAKAERFEKLDSVYYDYEANAKKVANQMAKARLGRQH